MDDTDVPRPEIIEVSEVPIAMVHAEVPTDQLPAFFDSAFTQLSEVLADQGVPVAGPAFARYHGPPGEVAVLDVGFPVGREVATSGDVVSGSLPAGRVARAVHAGGFDGLGDAWDRLAAWIDETGETPGDALWEVYLTEPSPDMDPADLRTELDWLLD